MLIRDFKPEDAEKLVEILKANLQYSDPLAETPEAMLRVHKCQAAVFVVAEEDGVPVGFGQGVYDGAHALIYLVSVHPRYQRRGIGTALVKEMARRFKALGATSLCATVPGDNLEFWKGLSFRLTTRIMFAHPIERVIEA